MQNIYKCCVSYKTTSVLLYFQYKIWLKPSAEQQFLYGHHVLKSGLGRITENTPKYQGVVVLSMNDLPLVSEQL
jgi:60S ribosome subunit biogenesis protein NIP7